MAPDGISLLFAGQVGGCAPAARLEPDVVLCAGFPWKLPQEALDVARLGSVNHHPGKLPRHRGPVPMAWALRDGDSEFGVTWHRMDAELDTGPILADDGADRGRRLHDRADRSKADHGLASRSCHRSSSVSRPGIPAIRRPRRAPPGRGTSARTTRLSTGRSPARKIHDQVRAWQLTFASLRGARADRRARRQASQASAHEPHRPGQRRAGRPVRRGSLDRRVRARRVVPGLMPRELPEAARAQSRASRR